MATQKNTPIKKPAKASKKTAAPKKQTSKLAVARTIDEVCAQILEGKMLTEIAKFHGITVSALSEWIANDPARSARAREARANSAQLYEEKAATGIAEAADPFELAKAKEMAHHLRWRASKINPKDYGDKVQVDANLNTNDMTDEELKRRLGEFGVVVVGAAHAGS